MSKTLPADDICPAPDSELEAIRARWTAKLQERGNCLALGFETGGMSHHPMGLVVTVLAGGRYESQMISAETLELAEDHDDLVASAIWMAVKRLHEALRQAK